MSRGAGAPTRSCAARAAEGLLALAVLALVAAAAYPSLRRAVFEHRVRAAIREMDAIRASARQVHLRTGAWPQSAPPGEMPAALRGALPPGVAFTGPHYRLEWDLFAGVREGDDARSEGRTADGVAPGPPVLDTLAGITLQSTERPLLAALLHHYGPLVSFARDSTWTLVVGAAERPDPREEPAPRAAPAGQTP